MFGIFRSRAKPAVLPEGYLSEVSDDMHACARLHALLRAEDEDSPSKVVSLLGGCFLSWASNKVANDWDFYLPISRKMSMVKRGYVFNDKLWRDVRDGGYGGKVVTEGWSVTSKPVIGREQIILVKDALAENAWTDFDYQHCMLGIDNDLDIVEAGLPTIATASLIKNPESNRHRAEKELRRKTRDKVVFGAGKEGRQKVEDTMQLYKTFLIKAIKAQDSMPKMGRRNPAYEGFMRALELR